MAQAKQRRLPNHSRRPAPRRTVGVAAARTILGTMAAGYVFYGLRSPSGKRLIRRGTKLAKRGLRLVSRAKRQGLSKAIKSTGRFKRVMGTKLSYRGSRLLLPARRFSSTVNRAKRGNKMYTKGFQTFTASPTTSKGTKRIAANLRRYGRKKGWAIVRRRTGKPTGHIHKH